MNTIAKYFNGERSESYIFILLGVIAFTMALYFIFGLKTSFWKGVAFPFILVACLEFIVGYTIVTRSPKDIIRVEKFVNSEPRNIKTIEIPRMENVLSNFVVFRFVEIAFIFIGILLMYSSLNDTFWRGIGLGFFIQASIVLSLDFFAERRGYIYLKHLNEITENL